MSGNRFSTGIAVVTGAAAGIGEGFVRHLASRGMAVVVADIDAEGAERVAADIRQSGRSAIAYSVDVTDFAAVDAMAQSLFDQHGAVDLLINNAGIETAGLTWEVDVERWKRVMEINVDGVFHAVKAFVPRMIAAKKPACVANVSSVGGINSVAVQGPYIVSKFAVLALTESLHQDMCLVDADIQVSAIVPHSVRSNIFHAARRDAPTDNPVANAVFDAMQRDNVLAGLDPVRAATHMTEMLAKGEFWVFSHDDLCAESLDRRASQLTDRRPPSDPRAMLERMGIRHRPEHNSAVHSMGAST
ncbi:NAD(P)-dependent dehydrogenase (short-subunit alcohol dehydrogenase family) [Rhodococcus fascians]|uniref:SDR family NAD(P)-dependent oxidoreductase n=1 Tax=Nocardiaceae TaxID=85025 RepID=UPI00050C7F83|nr:MULTISPECIES: SDR family NAD(P)-dependent oxidoreductase [Rhodococcus]MDR6910733.1 NAD(P)-dependent dehydrogenase (short-subunit alcohol dehydrogenase family) [Rhodococcus sp. 3258]MDR6931900.1 NAD(P)-dependent dehydrogenase (short-subunit alcohol dehydrogenase family) [Rhodococcus fascians]